MENEKDVIVLIVGDNIGISNSYESTEDLGMLLNPETGELSQTAHGQDCHCSETNTFKEKFSDVTLCEHNKTIVMNGEFIKTKEIKADSEELKNISLKELSGITQEQHKEESLTWTRKKLCLPDSNDFGKTEPKIDYIFNTEIEIEHNLEIDEIEMEGHNSFENKTQFEETSDKYDESQRRHKESKHFSVEKVKRHHGKLMKPLWEHKSFVNELRCQYPELEQDEELLISTLANIMKDIKTPTPPDDCYLMDGVNFKCSFCGRLSNQKCIAKLHYQNVHGPKYLACFACGSDFRCITTLYKHEKRCINKDAVIVLKARAQIIGERARNRPYLDIEKRREEILKEKKKKIIVSKPGNLCLKCNVKFSSKVALERHTLLHRGIRPHLCSICASAYSTRQGLIRHLKSHTTEEYICDICQKSFKRKDLLIPHLSSHYVKNRFECTKCGKQYTNKKDLITHMDTKHLNRPFPHICPVCNKGLSRLSSLGYHMKHKHGLTIITRKGLQRQLPKMSAMENETFVKSAVMVKYVNNCNEIVAPS